MRRRGGEGEKIERQEGTRERRNINIIQRGTAQETEGGGIRVSAITGGVVGVTVKKKYLTSFKLQPQLVVFVRRLQLSNALPQLFNLNSLLVIDCHDCFHGSVLCCIILIKSSSHKQDQTFWISFPSSGGDLDRELGWGEEGEDLGGDVVATVVHTLAEEPHDLLEG